MRLLESLSIRHKITFIITTTTCVAILLAGGAFLIFDVYNFRQSNVRDLETVARVLGSNSTAAMAFQDSTSGNEVLQALSAKGHILAACVYDDSGHLFSRYKSPAAGKNDDCPAPEADVSRFEATRLVVFRKIMLEQQAIGTIVLVSDLEELSELLRWHAAFLGLIVLCLSAGAYPVASRMQRTISAPILSLAATAKIVRTQKDYSVRVAQATHDEVGVLIEGFNEMLAEIQRRDGELQKAQDELERRVEERTSELRREISVREQTEGALRETEERTRSLLDSTAEAIFGVDLGGHCTFCNRATLRLLGYGKPDDVLGREMHEMIHHTRADGSHYPVEECPISRAMRNGDPFHKDDEVLWRSDRTSFPAEYWSHPVQRDGRAVGAVVTFVDITERHAAQKVLQARQGSRGSGQPRQERVSGQHEP